MKLNKINAQIIQMDAEKMEFELRILKWEIINMRKQNRKHNSQIRKWNVNELREEVHKLSEQQELIERAMLQDHVSPGVELFTEFSFSSFHELKIV